jgi:predicted nucleotidyltransferase
MILSPAYLTWLLDESAKQLSLPRDYGALLEGSIAEGFGNHSSDIDFLLISDGDREYPTMPSVLFVDGRRVEVRTRSVRQMREQIDRLTTPARAGRVSRIPEDLLNRCQRFAGAFTLRPRAYVDDLRAALPRAECAAIVSRWFAHYARQSMRYAVALAALGQADGAARWAAVALVQAMKSWLAARGESYLEPKWVAEQLARVPESAPLAGRYWKLVRPQLETPGYVRDCAELLGELGISDHAANPALVSVGRRSGVTTWGPRERLHAVRNRRDVFVLSPEASRAWGTIVFGRPLAELVIGDDAPRCGGLLAEFHRLGLISLRWRDGTTIQPAQPFSSSLPVTPSPSRARPILTADGGRLDPGSGHDVQLIPLPADRFASAVMALIWANIMMENAREDYVGAAGAAQWRVAESTARRLLQHTCRGILSAYGVCPLPPDSDMVASVAAIPHLPERVGQTALRLESSLRVDSKDAAEATIGALDGFVSAVRALTGTELFPSSFDSADSWRKTLEIGYEWVRLGAHVGASFPLGEALDLLESGGRQPHGRK